MGHALRESGIPRAELFVTTKLPYDPNPTFKLDFCQTDQFISSLRNFAHHKVRESFDKSLEDLDCDYIDLYLLHWPQAMLDVGAYPFFTSSLDSI